MYKVSMNNQIMARISEDGKTNVYYRLLGGLCGVVKNVIDVEVWETENAVTLATEDNSKITLPTEIIDIICLMGD